MILDETMGLLQKLYGEELAAIRIERIVIGLFFTGVKLSNGAGGVAYTPKDELSVATCCPAMAVMGETRASFKGMDVGEAFRRATDSPLAGLVALTVMNALSTRFIDADRYRVIYDTDVLDLIDFNRAGKIGMVGAFGPFLKRIKNMPGVDLTVIERKKESLRQDEMHFYAPAEEASVILPACHTAILTGSSIANGTIEELLSFTRPGAAVIVTGPTASMLPEALFARNATIVSGVQVTDPDLALDIVSEGLGAYHLFDTCVRKLNIIRD